MSRTSSNAAARGSVPELDGVRGLAIVGVLALHTVGKSAGPVVGKVLMAGWAGVDLFFVLSGYLITGVLLRARGRPHYFRNFYARRILRIWPLYMVLTAITFGALSFGPVPFSNSPRLWVPYVLFVQNLTNLRQFGVWPLAVSWSLAIEEQFYLVWPWLVSTLSRRSLRLACVALLIVEPFARAVALRSGCPAITIYACTPFHLDGLLAGAIVATLRDEGIKAPRATLPAATALVLASLACIIGVLHGSDIVVQDTVLTAAPLIAADAVVFSALALGFSGGLFWVVSTLEHDTAIHRFLRNSTLRWCGRVSYGLYLFHGLVIPLNHASIQPWLGARTGLTGAPLTAAGIAVEYAVFGALTLLSFRYLELPFLGLKRYFEGAPQPGRMDGAARTSLSS